MINSNKGSILIVDDNSPNLRTLSAMLTKEGYRTRDASDGPTALTLAQADPPDLILLDIKMPEMDGYQVCRRLKADENTKDIPILFISALRNLQDKVKGFAVGGVDYITKPFQLEEILARVQTHLALRNLQKRLEVQNAQLQQEIAERERLEKELLRLATTDALTGANNRLYFMEKAQEELVRSQRYGNSLSLLMIDIDHFKRINDTYGHAVGDEVLKAMVRKCLATLRETDIFGRLGGEEFAAVLTETDSEDALLAAERLRQKLAELSVFTDSKSIRFTVSIGLASTQKDDTLLEDVLKQADKALYEAKKSGRNCVVQR